MAEKLGPLIEQLVASHPELADVAHKIGQPPQGAPPAPTECERCGARVDPLWSLGAWRRGRCERCEGRELARDVEAARERLLARRVEHDARGQLAGMLGQRHALRPELSAWLDEGRAEGAWLYLHGPPGTGKTSQLLELVRAIHRRRIWGAPAPTEAWEVADLDVGLKRDRLAYISEPALLRSCQPDGGKTTQDWIREPLLLVDEVCRQSRPLAEARRGRPALSPWAEGVLFDIYDGRYARGAPTVLCSNYSPTALMEREGVWSDEAMHSRLLQRLELGRWVVSFEDAPNWRLEAMR